MADEPDTLFDHISGKLKIQLSKAAEPIAPNHSNEKAPADAQIVSLAFVATICEDDAFRALTAGELDEVALTSREIRLKSDRGEGVLQFAAPNGVHFTVRDLIAAIEKTERETRPKGKWFGGIDVHHVFFEGLSRGEDGTWSINWGS